METTGSEVRDRFIRMMELRQEVLAKDRTYGYFGGRKFEEEPEEGRRLMNLCSVMGRQDYTTILALKYGVLEVDAELYFGYCFKFAAELVLRDLAEASFKELSAEAQLSVLLNQWLHGWRSFTGRFNYLEVIRLGNEVFADLENWYYGDDSSGNFAKFATGDDGYDYLTAALFTLIHLSATVDDVGRIDIEHFNRWVAAAEPEFERGACDGDPRYGWLWAYYIEKFEVPIQGDSEEEFNEDTEKDSIQVLENAVANMEKR